jgi:hypothetical protein
MDEELERFKREINLTEYAASCGYVLIVRERRGRDKLRGSTASSILMENRGTGDKVVIARDRDGHWTFFSVRDGGDNGTIIDFVQHRKGAGLGGVRKELRHWIGQLRPQVSPEHFVDVVSVQTQDRDAVRATYAAARVRPNSPYLNSRGIRPETLAHDRFRVSWREDVRGNVLFPHRDGPCIDDVCGYEVKNRGFTGFAPGGRKTIWISATRRGDRSLIVAESAIDAISYHQLHPDAHTRYVSTGGSFGPPQAQYLVRAIARMPADTHIVAAVDNDRGGDRIVDQLAALTGGRPLTRARSPVGKDWNDCLQAAEREYIRSLRRGLEITS